MGLLPLQELGDVLQEEPWVSSGAALGLGDAQPPAPDTSVPRSFLASGRAVGGLGGYVEQRGFGPA